MGVGLCSGWVRVWTCSPRFKLLQRDSDDDGGVGGALLTEGLGKLSCLDCGLPREASAPVRAAWHHAGMAVPAAATCRRVRRGVLSEALLFGTESAAPAVGASRPTRRLAARGLPESLLGTVGVGGFQSWWLILRSLQAGLGLQDASRARCIQGRPRRLQIQASEESDTECIPQTAGGRRRVPVPCRLDGWR